MSLTKLQHNLHYNITAVYYGNNMYQMSLSLIRESDYQGCKLQVCFWDVTATK